MAILLRRTGGLRSISDHQHDAAASSRRFDPLVRCRDLFERELLRDLEPAPPRGKRLIHGFRGLGLVRRCEVIAAQEVDAYVLEEQRPERNAWRGDIRGIRRYRSMNRQQFQIRGDVCATRR